MLGQPRAWRTRNLTLHRPVFLLSVPTNPPQFRHFCAGKNPSAPQRLRSAANLVARSASTPTAKRLPPAQVVAHPNPYLQGSSGEVRRAP